MVYNLKVNLLRSRVKKLFNSKPINTFNLLFGLYILVVTICFTP